MIVNGRLHWETCNQKYQKILSFGLEDEQFRVVPILNSLWLGTFNYMVKLRGCLCEVKLDYENMGYERI